MASGLVAAPPRGHAAARALAVLRLRLAARGGAVPVASAAPTRRAARSSRRRSWTTSARCSPTSCGRAAAAGCWPRSRGRRPRRRRRTSCAARRRPPRSARRRRRSARRPTPRSCALLAARDRESARGLETFAGCPVKWLIEHVLRPGPVDPDPEPMRRGSLGHAVLERTLRGLQGSAPAPRGSTPETLEAALARAARRDRRAPGRARARPHGKAAARALEVDLERYIRHEATTGAGYEPAQLEWSFDDAHDRRRRGQRPRRPRRHRRRAARSSATTRAAPSTRARAGPRTAGSRPRCTRSPCASSSGVEIVGALYQPIGTADQRPRGVVRDDVPGRYVNGDVSDDATLDARAGGRRARSPPRPPPTCAPAASSPAPTAARYNGGCAHPGICRVDEAASPPSSAPRSTPARGSSLLAANAGSGKTAVMVERIAAAVREDGVPVGAILALTFTEKAAGELAERLRRRLTELGEDEHARAVDGAWIGTIHGFCARLLRSQPLAAGLDPRFEVLEETAAERLANAAYERALEALGARRGPGRDRPRRLLRPRRCATWSRAPTRRCAPAATSRPRLVIPPPRRRARPGARWRPRGRPRCATSPAPGDGVARDAAARAALERVRRSRWREARAVAGRARRRRAQGRRQGAHLGRRARPTAPPGRAYRAACADYPRRARALTLIDALLDRYGAAFDARQARARRGRLRRPRAARAATCSPTRRPAQRWAERFALIMIDEFQDTNAVQLGHPRGARARQPVRGRRRVPVDLPLPARGRDDLPRPRARRSTRAVRTLTINFRSREELLDVLNAAFAPELGERFSPLRAGRQEPPIDDARRAAAVRARPARRRAARRAADHRHAGLGRAAPRLGLAGGGDQPWRRAEARLIADRLRAEVDAGRRAGDIVVLVRATASLRLLEEALEEQGLPTYVVGGRGYWSQEQVRDGLAWLRVLANPHDEEALLTVLSSPVPRRRHRRARPADRGRPRPRQPVGRASRRPTAPIAQLLAAEREHAPSARRSRSCSSARSSPPATTSRSLARPGGDRRLANLRKLMRLAGEYERAEGRDLRGFLADAAGARPRRGARGRGRARVRRPGRRAADDDPPRQGARVPGRLRRRPRPPVRRPPLAAARRRGRHRRPAPRPARRRRHDPDDRLGAPRRRPRSKPTPRRSGACSTSR